MHIELDQNYLFWNPAFASLHNKVVKVIDQTEGCLSYNAVFPNGNVIAVSGTELRPLGGS